MAANSPTPPLPPSPPAVQGASAPTTEKDAHHNNQNGLLTPLPLHNNNPEAGDESGLTRELTPVEKIKRSLGVRPAGESGRRGIHPVRFLKNVFRSASWASRVVNVLWPVVPAAIAVNYALPHQNLAIFILSYLAMVPCANLIGYAGQELGRKLPHVIGIITETT